MLWSEKNNNSIRIAEPCKNCSDITYSATLLEFGADHNNQITVFREKLSRAGIAAEDFRHYTIGNMNQEGNYPNAEQFIKNHIVLSNNRNFTKEQLISISSVMQETNQ